MKVRFLPLFVILLSLFNGSVYSQSDTGELGLPGDNLDLYAVLDLFQKSKTIEEFEKNLNDDKAKINNLDLNGDKKIDFIKVETKKDGDDFTFILRDPINKSETQDVAVIYVSKDKNKKISMQIVGDKDLYGKDYIIEPSPKGNAGVTANPAYTGSNPVTVNVPAQTTTVVVEQAPIVQYVYSPAYVPYYPPYYYGYYPPWFGFATVMAVGIYRHNHYHYHGGGYGYHHTNVYVNHHSHNNYNNFNRNTTNNISRDNINNNINSNNRNRETNRNSNNRNSVSNRDNSSRNSVASRDGVGSSSRPSASTSDRSSMSNRSSSGISDRSSSSRASASNSMSSRSSGSSFGGSSSGGFRSSGGGGGFRGGGGSFGGGGGGRRR